MLVRHKFPIKALYWSLRYISYPKSFYSTRLWAMSACRSEVIELVQALERLKSPRTCRGAELFDSSFPPAALRERADSERLPLLTMIAKVGGVCVAPIRLERIANVPPGEFRQNTAGSDGVLGAFKS
jgi:hypothetical protein